ncbi:hypothetical protein AOLI_G00099420 [Acnodon oligacanthus]
MSRVMSRLQWSLGLCWPSRREKGLKGEAPCQVLVTQRVEFAASATKDLGETHLHKQEAHNKMPPSNLCLSPRRKLLNVKAVQGAGHVPEQLLSGPCATPVQCANGRAAVERAAPRALRVTALTPSAFN